MPRIDIDLSGGLYQSDSLPIANMECNNWYVNIPQVQGALSPANLFGTPGLTQLSTSGNIKFINRGSHVKADIPYFVQGNELIRVDQTFDGQGNEILTEVSLGTIEGAGGVSMADNGTQLMILVPGGKGYIMDEDASPTVTEISDVVFIGLTAQYVEFIDSFFIVTNDNKTFNKSAANDGLSWNALDFGTAEADPDKIVAPHVHKNQLFIAGSETIEVFENRGIGGFPFQRINGFIINKGVFAPLSLIEANDTFMFIGGGVNESPAVWALSGSSVQKVSNTAIDAALQKFSQAEIQQAFAFSYAQKGAYFVGFAFPTRSFVFDTISQKWHERTSKITDVEGFTSIIRWRVNSLVTAYNKVMCGDSQDGRIGSLETDTYTEYDSEIIRTFTTIPLANQSQPVSVSQIEATFESGVGLSGGTEPQMRMSFSDDARTFGNEVWRGMGKIGEYFKRAIWHRLGRVPRYRIFKFEMSDPVKPVMIKLEANVRGGQVGN